MKSKIRGLAQTLKLLNRRFQSVIKHWASLNTFLSYCERSEPGFEGSVQPVELEFLKELVIQAQCISGPIIEVGTLFGFTTQAIASWKDPSKALITIDNYSWNPVGLVPQAHRDFTRRTLYYLSNKCETTLFEGLSTDFYAAYDGVTPSMIFIDASHEYEHVLSDINWAKSNGVPIIAGHDYSRFWPGVQRAVEESFGTEFKVKGTLWAHCKFAN
jgi:predicted O-methyltransferase YrrM